MTKTYNKGLRFGQLSHSVITAEGSFKPAWDNDFKGDQYVREDSALLKINDSSIVRWGPDNLKPLTWIKLLSESNIAPQILLTKVDFACGERLFTYREELRFSEKSGQTELVKIPVANPQLEFWLKKIKAKDLMRKRATDYYFSGNCFAKMVLARDPEKFGVAHIDHLDSCSVRVEQIKNKRVNHIYMSDNWVNPVYNPKDISKGNTRRFKTYNEAKPLAFFRSVLQSKIYWPGQVYYGIQPWHSAKNWIGFANKIPVWMGSNITNSYNIKYHIKYPADYFAYTDGWDKDAIEKEEDRIFDQVDNWLAGELNAGKTFYSKRILDPMTGNERSSWTIEPIKNDLQDKSFLEAYKTSQGAMTSGWDLNPNLANIPQEGKFSTSGSELRIAYQIHVALKVAAARSVMLEPLEEAYKVNNSLGVPGFQDPEIKFGFINRNIVTLAENPAGIESDSQIN